MMALDPLNNLNEWPLKNLDLFIQQCLEKNIKEINVTGSNTDPLLYKHDTKLVWTLRECVPNIRIGIRTNGVLWGGSVWDLYDKASISLTSLDPELYVKTMGMGLPPDIKKMIPSDPSKDLKVNIVLCPETVYSGDLIKTIQSLVDLGIKRINLREPYGQPHIGNPMVQLREQPDFLTMGMPSYRFGNTSVTYWDVHYVEVESINLYANGIVSTTYPVSKGHCPDTGKVLDQGHFNKSGRIIEQWKYKEKIT